jgi:hypothetical protein
VQATINQTTRREQPPVTCLALSFGENVIISVDTTECCASLLGQSRHFECSPGTSGLPPARLVRFVPKNGLRAASVPGPLLSFAAHWILVQVAAGIVAQMLVSVLGIVLLVGIAWIATLYRSLPTLVGTETRVIRIGKDVP